MRCSLVRPLQQRREVLLKNVVVLLTAKQPMLAEFGPGDLALIAGRPHLLLKPGVRHHKIRQQLVDGSVPLDGLRHPLALGGALLAQMLLDLLAVLDLGEMHGGRLVAVVTFEHCAPDLFDQSYFARRAASIRIIPRNAYSANRNHPHHRQGPLRRTASRRTVCGTRAPPRSWPA